MTAQPVELVPDKEETPVRFLGDFTAAVEESRRASGDERATFTLYGQTFTMATEMAGLPYLEFCHAAFSGLDTADAQAGAAQRDFIKGCLADGDWPRFALLVTERRLSTDQLMRLTEMLLERFTGGPTSSPSDSDGGRSTTTRSSKGTSRRRDAAPSA